ncbi:MAG: aspartate aminotransferase family protein [Bacteroidetes bacterium]|nr:aspartate aminotransferase family protein [Bacteroidota bacterium]MBV6461651.1 Putrescine aminotransferase [Flavobacteriales bacterium]WKZ74129.1 MAG: aspartate aminotransferase family protein [Vicingaceae bacterium]MCL4816802.1 aspartate aminotransferase family protein [Flavobacteriales bacterium]NOG95740.1 aspartate aminotransferase family protein [Bacteroidota bacterium]
MPSNRQLFLQHLAQTSDLPMALEIEKAEGVFLYDTNGKKYFDLISGIAVSNLGHKHPKVSEAVKKQTDEFMHLMVYGEYIQTPQVKLAKKLADVLPSSLSCTYFVNSGSEAIEGALKLAKRYTGRNKIISFTNAYHGSSHGALSICGNEDFKRAFYPLLPNVFHLPYNSFSELKEIDYNTACVVIEPIQAEAGIILPEEDFLMEIRKKCTENNVLLIFDEIQTGFGRTGSLFGFEKHKVIPDILVLAKGFGGGLPLGAFISSKEIMHCFTNNPILGHITTFGGNALSCAASLATLEELLYNQSLINQIPSKENLFLKLLKGKKIKNIRSAGLMLAIEFENFETNKAIIDACVENGVITDWFLFNSQSMRIAPPLIITHEQIEECCKKINEAINQ